MTIPPTLTSGRRSRRLRELAPFLPAGFVLVGLFFVPRAFAVLAVLLLAYQTAVAMIFVGVTRYRVPWDFLLCLLAGATVLEVVRRLREWRVAGAQEAASQG